MGDRTPDSWLEHMRAVTSDPFPPREEFLTLWEPDGVVEFPNGRLNGLPSRLEGREEIYEYMVQTPTRFVGGWRVPEVTPVATGEEGVYFAEFSASSTSIIGRPYEQTYVVRFVIAPSGRVAFVREYWDSAVFIQSFGLAELEHLVR